jgi:osmotically-inducible protein OsmY
MKKLTMLLMSGVLMFGAVACSNPQTAANAPDSTKDAPKAPTADETQANKQDATSETRRQQVNADIKAREERNNALNGGAAENRSDGDIESEVRSKLEANMPESALVVKSDKGVVTVSGTVPKQEQLAKIQTEATKIKGVKSVNVKATVAAPKADSKDNKSKAQ